MSVENFSQVFIDEAQELLESLEEKLLHLENNPEDNEAINSVFRVMHTIKGSSAMFGFEQVAWFAHRVEEILDDVRNGKRKVDNPVINFTLNSRDHLLQLLYNNGDASLQKISETIISDFDPELLSEKKKETISEKDTEKKIEKNESLQKNWAIHFQPGESLFLSGMDPLFILKDLEELGKITVVLSVDRIPANDSFNAEKCYLGWDILLTTEASLDDIKDVFIFVESESILNFHEIKQNEEIKIGELLQQNGFVSGNEIQEALDKQEKIGELLLKEKKVSKQQIKVSLAQQKHIKEQKTETEVKKSTSIRVSSDKLDQLVDLVGELVTIQARVNQMVSTDENNALDSINERLERITHELRDNAMSLRMLPIGTIYSRFRRLIRDLSNQLNKNVDLKLFGEETELDKTVIERLTDPLVHVIRNSMDHGIETPEERREKNKDETGTLKITAYHQGASVIIEVEDDGAGMDKNRLLEKAISKGLASPDKQYTDSEILNFTFEAGFSTKAKVTDVSGRGVGMDVVRREIESLGGSVYLQSELGSFTKTTFLLPLTLAIIEGFLVYVGDAPYILPLSAVKACMELGSSAIEEKSSGRYIPYRDSIVPLILSREVLEEKSETPEKQHVIVLESSDSEIGFVVDQVIGEYQTVIKNLGKVFSSAHYISGATIMGDGTIGLLLDIKNLYSPKKTQEVVPQNAVE